MLKRKHADRSDWKRVTRRIYRQGYIEFKDFTGYIALLSVLEVSAPLFVDVNGQRICIVDNGYDWLQQIPDHGSHALTTIFDRSGRIVQWYIDICLRTGVDERNVPWFDDLFLDVVLLPSGDLTIKDATELEEARLAGEVGITEYEQAWAEANRIVTAIKSNRFRLIHLAAAHRKTLLGPNQCQAVTESVTE